MKTVRVPDNLDTSDIVRLAGANQVIPSAKGRWGERLSVGITQDLVATLSGLLPQAVIENRGGFEPSRRLLVTISRFDIAPDGRCVLSARWRLTDAAGKVLSDSDLSRHPTLNNVQLCILGIGLVLYIGRRDAALC